jgi:hypothetical protein
MLVLLPVEHKPSRSSRLFMSRFNIVSHATRSLPFKRVLSRSIEDRDDGCSNSPRGSERVQIPVADRARGRHPGRVRSMRDGGGYGRDVEEQCGPGGVVQR